VKNTVKSSSLKLNGRLARGASVNLAGKVFGRALHFTSQLLLARWLGPFLFGLYSIGWNYARGLSLLASLGMDSGVIHLGMRDWGGEKKKISELIVGAVAISFLAGSGLGMVTFLAAPAAARWFDKPELIIVFRLFAALLPLMAGVKVAAAATRITKEMIYANLVEELSQPGINLLMIAAVMLIGGGLDSYILAAVFSFGLSLAAAGVLLRKQLVFEVNLKKALSSSSQDLLKYSLPISGPVILGTVVMMLDRMLVGYFLPEEQAGIYQTVAITSALFIAVLSAFKTILAPLVAELYHQSDKQGLERMVQTSTRWAITLCLPFLLVLLIAPESFLRTFFGGAYQGGARVLSLLTLAQLINLGGGAVDQVLVMTGNQRSWLKASGLIFLITTVLFPFLIPRWGMMGAAAVNIWIFTGLSISGVYLVITRVGVMPFDSGTLKTAAAAGLTTGGMVLVRTLVDGNGAWYFLLQLTAAVALFVILLISMGLEESDREIIGQIRNRIGF